MASPMTIHRDWLKQIPREGIFVTPAALVAAEAFPMPAKPYVLREPLAGLSGADPEKPDARGPLDDVAAALARASGDSGTLTQPSVFLFDPAGLGWPKDQFTTLASGVDSDTLRAALDSVAPAFSPHTLLGALRAPEPETGWVAVVLDDGDSAADATALLARTSQAVALGRAIGAPLVILFGGREIRLIATQHGSPAWLSFPVAQLLSEDRLLLGALHMLIGERRLLSLPDDKRLPALLSASRATKITSLQLAGFGVFEHAQLDLSPGINVILGPNGSGKTHALKALYAVLRGLAGKDDTVGRRDEVARKLAGVLKPDGDDLGRLVHWGYRNAVIGVRGEWGDPAELLFTTEGEVLLSDGQKDKEKVRLNDAWPGPERILYLPTREILALYEGFTAAYQTRQIAFDETLYDACLALESPILRAPPDLLLTLLPRLEKVIGGDVILRGNRFYVKKDDRLVEAHLLAEGIRKIAGLAQLIANGSIAPHGLLIWDEPEGNLNPTLIVKVADLLVDLAAQGVQILVASHDYLFVRRLSLISEYKKRPDVPIRFFGLCPTDHHGVLVEQGEVLADLAHNPILDEFTRQADFEQALFYGVDA